MKKEELFEVVQQVLAHLANDETPLWRRIRKELQWMLFWPLAKAVVLFWLIYVVITIISNAAAAG